MYLLSLITIIAVVPLPVLSRQKGGTLGEVYKEYQDIKDATDKAKAAVSNFNYGLKTYQQCRASGASNCPLLATLCWAFKQFGEPAIATNMVFADYVDVIINYYCLGEPTLKCCRKIAGGHCWSAFNRPAPINCEGNPHYGPTYTAGLCLRPCPSGCPGCLCNYLSDCAAGAGPRLQSPARRFKITERMPDKDTWFSIGRMASFYPTLSGYFSDRPALFSDTVDTATSAKNTKIFGILSTESSASSQILDFIFHRGCSSFISTSLRLGNAVPSFDITNWRGTVISRTDDIVDALLPVRAALPQYAAARLGASVPNFWLKIDNISATNWDDGRRALALSDAGIDDVEREMLKYVDLGGLGLLREVLGKNWVLMAVPLNNGFQNAKSDKAIRIENGNSFDPCIDGDGRAFPVGIAQFTLNVNRDSRVLCDPARSSVIGCTNAFIMG